MPLIFIFFSILPHFSHASLEITEIMYDLEGSDAGTEWIEIYNNGSESIEVTNWHFYENETHHGLTPDIFSTLPGGAYALIVQDVATIRSLYGDSIKLIKSSFSLNNTGETLALSDEEKNIVGSISYSVDDGANGNGMSLQRNGNQWIQAMPTPGTTNQTEGEEDNDDEEEPDTEEDSSSSSSSSIKRQIPETRFQEEDVDYYEGFLLFGDQRFVGTEVEMEVFVEHTKNKKTTKLKRGRFYVNFGDGNFFKSEERFVTKHTYAYPGSYEVTFEFYRSSQPFPGEKPDVFMRKTLEIKPNAVHLGVDQSQGIIIENKTGGDIDIDGWMLKSFNQSYLFPPHSYLKKGSAITLGPQTHTLSYVNKNTPIRLFNNKREPVFSYPQDIIKKAPLVTDNNNAEQSDTLLSYAEASEVENPSHLEDFLVEYPDKHEVSFDSHDELFNENERLKKPSSSQFPLWTVIAVGGLALLLGLIKIFLVTRKEPIDNESKVLGHIELIE